MKELAFYYKKPIKKLCECTNGEYVYNNDAQIACVTYNEEGGYYSLHTYAIESMPHPETYVYPITIQTDMIMQEMRKHRERYYNANIMNPDFSRELEAELHNLMTIDDTVEGNGKKYQEIWDRMNERLNKRLEAAATLGIQPKDRF